MRRQADKNELDFLSTLLGEKPLEKEAVDLDPETAAALGIQTVSPNMLDQLEAGATKPTLQDAPAPAADAPAPEASQQAQAPAPAEQAEPQVDEEQPQPQQMEASSAAVGSFDATDAPPELDEGEEAPPEPEIPTRGTHGRLFGDKRAHPLQILEVLTNKYGTDWADWESDTLWWSLRRDFGPVGNLTRNKISALRVAVTTDTPWLDWDVFEDCGLSWNDIVPIIGTFQPMTPMQTAFTVTVLRGIRPDDEFDHEVKAYIAAILDEAGFVFAPNEYFDGAQELLDRKTWLVGFREQVSSAWERIKDVDPTSIDWNYENPLDIHLLKLMTVKHYVDERTALQNKPAGGATTSSAVQPPVP